MNIHRIDTIQNNKMIGIDLTISPQNSFKLERLHINYELKYYGFKTKQVIFINIEKQAEDCQNNLSSIFSISFCRWNKI